MLERGRRRSSSREKRRNRKKSKRDEVVGRTTLSKYIELLLAEKGTGGSLSLKPEQCSGSQEAIDTTRAQTTRELEHKSKNITGYTCVYTCIQKNTYPHTYIPTYIYTCIYIYTCMYPYPVLDIVGGVNLSPLPP